MDNLYTQSVNAISFREKLERLSLMAGDFMKLFTEMQDDYKSLRSPTHRNTYNLLLSTLVAKIISSHPEESDMFMDEELLSVIIDLLQKKIAVKLSTPGQVWDSEITNKACKIVAGTPLDERRENPDLLKCVSELPAFHPLRAGPGSWHAIHLIASDVKNQEDHQRACETIRLIQSAFYCEICNKHFGEYLEKFPPENEIKSPRSGNVFEEVIDTSTGDRFVVTKLFHWTVRFHNKVNEHRRNFKGSSSPLVVTLPEAYRIYYLKQFDTCESCKVKKDY